LKYLDDRSTIIINVRYRDCQQYYNTIPALHIVVMCGGLEGRFYFMILTT
jgi:hypothetical protein